MKTPYENLQKEIKRAGMNLKQVAHKAKIPYSTFHTNYCGRSSFSLDNAWKVKNSVGSDLPIAKLFERNDASGTA